MPITSTTHVGTPPQGQPPHWFNPETQNQNNHCPENTGSIQRLVLTKLCEFSKAKNNQLEARLFLLSKRNEVLESAQNFLSAATEKDVNNDNAFGAFKSTEMDLYIKIHQFKKYINFTASENIERVLDNNFASSLVSRIHPNKRGDDFDRIKNIYANHVRTTYNPPDDKLENLIPTDKISNFQIPEINTKIIDNSSNEEDWEVVIQQIDNWVQTFNTQSQMAMTDMQREMNQYNEITDMSTSFLNKIQRTTDTIVSNNRI